MRRPGAPATRLLAAISLALGIGLSPISSAAPAAGAVDFLEVHQFFAGADGYRWVLGATAYGPHGSASTADSALLLWLNSCHGSDIFGCRSAGRWRVPLPAGALRIASDGSTATLQATVGGSPLSVSLTAQSTSPVTAYDSAVETATPDPASPDFSAGATHELAAVGTVSFGGLRCTRHPDAFEPALIGMFAGAESSGGSFTEANAFESTAPPRGLGAGFIAGGRYRPACVTDAQPPPNSGYRLSSGPGAVVGAFTVERGHQPSLAEVMFDPATTGGDGDGLLLVKRRGTHSLAAGESVYASAAGGIALGGGYMPPRLLDPGDYSFAFWSNRGATLWFPPGTVRRITVARHPHVSSGHQVATTIGASSQVAAQWLTGSALDVGRDTYTVAQATLVEPSELVPPAGYNQVQICFKTAAGACDAGESGGDDGLNFDENYNPIRHPDTPIVIEPFSAFIGLPLYDRPAPGNYRAAASYQGTSPGTRFDLAYLSVDLP